ncbi:hypothetical protein PISMIDRAFT_9876 [Pisolithus microcarpus 441]|uniref:Uncharacterized protein n=1 Tax=Pisolithus microcarpus 441 TaxID=765257 RepID=A0A0C9Z778_9AGAM|nr:hypothetical protein BKA83DRAFT_9876 [Pisolithus microcarpus]KIK25106.1 hypothetical protein PISMIDRAFT_9876 [Pisolithus microcarpus 441]
MGVEISQVQGWDFSTPLLWGWGFSSWAFLDLLGHGDSEVVTSKDVMQFIVKLLVLTLKV